MRRVALRAGIAFALVLGLAALTAAEDKPTADAPAKPTWSGYVFVADGFGEVVKASETSVTIRITWMEAKNAKTGRRSLSGNHRNFHNPFQSRQKSPQLHEVHHDYTLEYLPQSLVRTKTLPRKTDESGKKVDYTDKEMEALREPAGATGYAANRSDVVAGTYLEVILIRDKNVAPEKATDNDLRVKYAIMWGKDPNPPKDIAGAGSGSADPKKKN